VLFSQRKLSFAFENDQHDKKAVTKVKKGMLSNKNTPFFFIFYFLFCFYFGNKYSNSIKKNKKQKLINLGMRKRQQMRLNLFFRCGATSAGSWLITARTSLTFTAIHRNVPTVHFLDLTNTIRGWVEFLFELPPWSSGQETNL
jgi:hypothetical protein